MKNMWMLSLTTIAAISLTTSSVHAGKKVVYFSATDVAQREAVQSGYGDYFLLHFDVPEDMTEIRHAYLEFYVDAAARESLGEVTNDSPIVEVYALKESLSGPLDENQFRTVSRPMVQNVRVGQNRRVVVDITEIVQLFKSDPTKNFGIVIGSLTGTRDGIFTIRDDDFSTTGMARITFIE